MAAGLFLAAILITIFKDADKQWQELSAEKEEVTAFWTPAEPDQPAVAHP